jgi:protein required for attachment to host cells
MNRRTFPEGTLILVCDGSKALLFENTGDDRNLTLKLVSERVERHSPTREMGEDRPTRVVDAMDGSRSGTDETDWHAEAEAAFLHVAAKELDKLVHDRKAADVVIAAPPRALGILREAIAAPTRAAVSAELAKDLVKTPTLEIERHMASLGQLK